MDEQDDPPDAADGADTHSTGGPADAARLDLDDVFTICKHPRRRFIVAALGERESWGLDALASRMVAREREIPVDDLGASAVERGCVSLLHVHAPVLSTHDVATVVSDTAQIWAGPNAPRLASLLDTLSEEFDGGIDAT